MERMTMRAPRGGEQAGDATGQTSEGQVEELIPGIPNEITLSQISTKLPRVDIDNLASVSRSWCNAIRSRKVYDHRVRSQSTEGCVYCDNSREEHVQTIKIYARDTKHRLKLPPLTSEHYAREGLAPRIRTVNGWEHHTPRPDEITQQVALDGKLYVLWGLDGKVNVLDVAGHRLWKQCADMLKPRRTFGSGSIAGKIFVYGGGVAHVSNGGTELYNPKEDTWTKIRTIAPLRSSPLAGRLRREIFWHVTGCWPSSPSHDHNTDGLEVYDPVKDEWRAVEPAGTPHERMFFGVGGFYSMSPLGLCNYDFEENSWGDMQSFSFPAIAPIDPVEISPVAILPDDGELLAILDWHSAGTSRSCLVQSRGFCSQNREIVWFKPEYATQHFPQHVYVHLDFGIQL
ncbi:unnamed protein product [Calypogeia fissa]